MKCFSKNCEETIVAYCIVDEFVACEKHAVADYFWYLNEVSL